MAQTTAAVYPSGQNREAIQPMLPSSNRITVVSDESRSANRDPSGFPMSLIGRSKKRHRNPKDQNRLVAKSGESNISSSGGRSKGKGSVGTTFVGLFTMV